MEGWSLENRRQKKLKKIAKNGKTWVAVMLFWSWLWEETCWKCTVVLIAKNIDFFCFHVFFEKQIAKNIGKHLCFIKTIVTEKFAEKTTKHVL